MGLTTTKPTKPLKCPRCESTNTKFCYYNNYNKSQPRHFCKGCKRHWTQGGLLRDVPVGGSRKNKLKITSSSRDDSEAGWIRCGGEGSTLITPRPFNPCSTNKWHHHKGKNKLKITSSSRDGNEVGWNRCGDQGLTLAPRLFNPCSANKWHHHKGKNKLKITSSSRDGNEVGWNKCGDQDLTLAPRLFNPRSANKWHHHKGKNKLKITSSSSDDNETEWIRCGDQDLTLTSKHFNPHPANKWHQNKLKITSSSRADNEAGWNKCGDQGLTLTPELFNLSCRTPPTSGITKEKSQMNVVQSKENYDQNSKENIFDNFLSTSLSYDDAIHNMFKGSIGTIPSSNIPTSSTTSSNIYNYMGNIDSTMEEESTITWQGPIRSSVMDNLSNYSNWDDIETLVSANDFDM